MMSYGILAESPGGTCWRPSPRRSGSRWSPARATSRWASIARSSCSATCGTWRAERRGTGGRSRRSSSRPRTRAAGDRGSGLHRPRQLRLHRRRDGRPPDPLVRLREQRHQLDGDGDDSGPDRDRRRRRRRRAGRDRRVDQPPGLGHPLQLRRHPGAQHHLLGQLRLRHQRRRLQRPLRRHLRSLLLRRHPRLRRRDLRPRQPAGLRRPVVAPGLLHLRGGEQRRPVRGRDRLQGGGLPRARGTPRGSATTRRPTRPTP